MQKEEIEEYVEGFLRDSIYQKKTDVDICVEKMVYQKICIGKKEMINSFFFGRRYEKQYRECYILENNQFCDFMYGIQMNDDAEFTIYIGGQIFYRIKLQKDILFYLPLPIFLYGIKYHSFEIVIHKHFIPKDEIEIQLFGIQGDSAILNKISSLLIYNTRVMSGMIGLTKFIEQQKWIENVYQDFDFQQKSNLFSPNEISIDLDKSGILSFHISHFPEKIYKEELIEKAWHPSRFQKWCI